MTERETAMICLARVSPRRADDYTSWVTVGMVLKQCGCTVDDWDSWSKHSIKWQPGVCAKKWDSFGKASPEKPVTIATLVRMAREDAGTESSQIRTGVALTWGSEIGRCTPAASLPPVLQFSPPRDGWQKNDLPRYLHALFREDEIVAYVVNAFQQCESGKWLPGGSGVCTRTAGDLIKECAKYDDLSYVVGDWKPEAGAWIRINPMDGQGVADANVVEFRHCLVESDTVDEASMIEILNRLRVPIAALVHSGGKSVHAIVRVQAGTDREEFRRRVEYLYALLEKHGVEVDKQNRNPSRLSRMPGVMRNGRPQYLIDTNLGCKTWDEWRDFVAKEKALQLRTYSAAQLARTEFEAPRWAVPGLIPEGVTLIVGKPKSGKSWLALSICRAVAQGGLVLGKIKVEKGRALYLALEDGPRRLKHRLLETGADMPKDLLLTTDLPDLDKGVCLDVLERWIEANHDCKVVVIDTLARIRPPTRRGANIYEEDTTFMARLQKMAITRKIALILIHHTRKAGSNDPFDMASGSTGLVGVADTTIIFESARHTADRTLHITGRDVEERSLALRFEKGTWTLLDDSPEHTMSGERRQIVEVMRKVGSPMSPTQVGHLLGKLRANVNKMMLAMKADGVLTSDGTGRYAVAGNSGNSGNSGSPGTSSPPSNSLDSPMTLGDSACEALSSYIPSDTLSSLTALPRSRGVTSVAGVTAVTAVTAREPECSVPGRVPA